MQTFSGTYDNPLLDEVSSIDRFAYGVAINCCKSNGYFVVSGVVSSHGEEDKEGAG
jgi:hypothetical protein